MADAKKRTTTMTPPFRTAFLNAFRPRAAEEGKKGSYGVCALFPKKDPKVREFLKELKAACERKAKEHFPEGIPKKCQWWPLRDGDEERDGEEFKGMYFLNMKSGQRPGVVDQDLVEIIDEEEFRSGHWARATINPYFYDKKGNMGVAIGLNNLQKLSCPKGYSDDPLTSRSSAEDDFGSASSGVQEETGDDDDLL